MSRSSLMLLGFLSFNMLVPTVRGDDPEKAQPLPTVIYKKSDLTTSTALQTPIDISAVEMPLRDVLAYISDFAHVQIYTDPTALEDVGIELDQPVTMELKKVPVRQVLDLLLTKWGLTYIAKENFVLITDEDELVTRVYPIVDILHAQRNENDTWFVKSYRDLIIETISPDSWAMYGGQGTIAFSPVNTSFVITASAKQHARIEALLDDLRSAGLATHDWLEAEGEEAKSWQPKLVGMLAATAESDWMAKQESAIRKAEYAPGTIEPGMGGGMGGGWASAAPLDSRSRLEVTKLQAEVEKLKAQIKRLEAKESEDRR